MIDPVLQRYRALTSQVWAAYYWRRMDHYRGGGARHAAKRFQLLAAKEYAKARRIMGIS